MATLSGVLEFSMGGFLCLRGYADYQTLAKISKENPDVQRSLIEEHKGEMADFLNNGQYRFFPELVLSLSLITLPQATPKEYTDVEEFFNAMRSRTSWRSKSIGDYNISVFYHDAGDKNRIAHITFDDNAVKLNRIDGNHRLSAADSVNGIFTVPFCLIICRTATEEKQNSTAIFHNINAKQIPLNLEQNLSVILEHSDVFPDSLLQKDESFGLHYYLARKTIQEIDFDYFQYIRNYIQAEKCSFFVDIYGFLLNNGSLPKDETAVSILKTQLTEIETALRESQIAATTTNIAVIGALAYYKITNASQYRAFLSWIKKNNVGSVKKIHIEDVINLYDTIYENAPKKAFLARWYPSETDGEITTKHAEARLEAIKEVAKEFDLELIDLGTKETGSFDIRQVMYHEIQDCDIFIADLTGARHNVMIEVGYALKHVGTGRMVFYFEESETCKTVPFDVNHLQYDPIVVAGDIKDHTRNRIKSILQRAKNGEI